MKVAQKNPTNPITRSVHLSDASNYLNMKFSPPVICLTQVRNRENIPGWFSPSPISCSHTLGHTRHSILPRYSFVMLCLLYIYCFFPLFSPVDPETDVAPVIDYVDDNPSLPEQPGKPPRFDHLDIANSILSCLH